MAYTEPQAYILSLTDAGSGQQVTLTELSDDPGKYVETGICPVQHVLLFRHFGVSPPPPPQPPPHTQPPPPTHRDIKRALNKLVSADEPVSVQLYADTGRSLAFSTLIDAVTHAHTHPDTPAVQAFAIAPSTLGPHVQLPVPDMQTVPSATSLRSTAEQWQAVRTAWQTIVIQSAQHGPHYQTVLNAVTGFWSQITCGQATPDPVAASVLLHAAEIAAASNWARACARRCARLQHAAQLLVKYHVDGVQPMQKHARALAAAVDKDVHLAERLVSRISIYLDRLSQKIVHPALAAACPPSPLTAALGMMPPSLSLSKPISTVMEERSGSTPMEVASPATRAQSSTSTHEPPVSLAAYVDPDGVHKAGEALKAAASKLSAMTKEAAASASDLSATAQSMAMEVSTAVTANAPDITAEERAAAKGSQSSAGSRASPNLATDASAASAASLTPARRCAIAWHDAVATIHAAAELSSSACADLLSKRSPDAAKFADSAAETAAELLPAIARASSVVPTLHDALQGMVRPFRDAVHQVTVARSARSKTHAMLQQASETRSQLQADMRALSLLRGMGDAHDAAVAECARRHAAAREIERWRAAAEAQLQALAAAESEARQKFIRQHGAYLPESLVPYLSATAVDVQVACDAGLETTPDIGAIPEAARSYLSKDGSSKEPGLSDSVISARTNTITPNLTAVSTPAGMLGTAPSFRLTPSATPLTESVKASPLILPQQAPASSLPGMDLLVQALTSSTRKRRTSVDSASGMEDSAAGAGPGRPRSFSALSSSQRSLGGVTLVPLHPAVFGRVYLGHSVGSDESATSPSLPPLPGPVQMVTSVSESGHVGVSTVLVSAITPMGDMSAGAAASPLVVGDVDMGQTDSGPAASAPEQTRAATPPASHGASAPTPGNQMVAQRSYRDALAGPRLNSASRGSAQRSVRRTQLRARARDAGRRSVSEDWGGNAGTSGPGQAVGTPPDSSRPNSSNSSPGVRPVSGTLYERSQSFLAAVAARGVSSQSCTQPSTSHVDLRGDAGVVNRERRSNSAASAHSGRSAAQRASASAQPSPGNSSKSGSTPASSSSKPSAAPMTAFDMLKGGLFQ